MGHFNYLEKVEREEGNFVGGLIRACFLLPVLPPFFQLTDTDDKDIFNTLRRPQRPQRE